MDKKYLDWSDIEFAVERLAINIINSKIEIAAVGGLPRGGLIPAVLLSHKMNIPFVSQANVKLITGNILIVDDICDTGNTFNIIRDIYGNEKHLEFEFASLFVKDSKSHLVDYYGLSVSDGIWLDFPWE